MMRIGRAGMKFDGMRPACFQIVLYGQPEIPAYGSRYIIAASIGSSIRKIHVRTKCNLRMCVAPNPQKQKVQPRG